MARSPIKLECEWLMPPAEALRYVREHGTLLPSRFKTDKAMARSEFRICKWRCRGPVKAARFVEKKNPGRYAIVHPATRKPGTWQVSYFDSEGASGHAERASCTEAVAELRTWEYRLQEVS